MMALYTVRHSIFTLLLDVVDSSKEEFLKGSPEPNGSEVNTYLVFQILISLIFMKS
jgi:hypothetical protein